MFRLPPPYLWTPLSPQRVKGCSPLTIPKKKSKRKKASRCAKTGCGAQRPLRALSGTRVLLTAAPTAPPCIRRRRRSSLLRIFLCFSHLRLRRRFHVVAGLHALQGRNASCEAASRRNEKKAFSAAASFFPFRHLLRDYQGRVALDSCLPRLESSGCFSGSLLARKRELSLTATAIYPAQPARNSVSLFHTLHFASGFTLSIYSPPAQYSAAPHPRATRPGCVPPAPDSSDGCGPAFHGLPASGR